MENEQHTDIDPKFRCGYTAIVGEPNVGKSTLMNQLVGQKISIVTAKPQTTRHKILGIYSTESAQMIFLDTPGMLMPKYLLHEHMMNAATSAIREADIAVLMIDCSKPDVKKEADHDVAFNALKKANKPVYLVLNKTDLVKKQEIAELIVLYSGKYEFKEIFPISAMKGEGTKELLASLVAELPIHPPLYPLDIVSEHPERFFVSEIIREKIFEQFREEIPYSTSVDIVQFKEQKGRKDLIEAEIYVERDSQKGILIGKQGKALKEIGELARKDIESFLGRPVFLQLHVKVREKWREDKNWLQRLGYSS